MVRLTDRPDMTLDVYRGRKTTIQPIQLDFCIISFHLSPEISDILLKGCHTQYPSSLSIIDGHYATLKSFESHNYLKILSLRPDS